MKTRSSLLLLCLLAHRALGSPLERRRRRSMLCLLLFPVITLGGFKSAHAVETDFEKDQSLPVVYINVAIKAGSTSDPNHESGLSNFMGEMLLRGTQSKTKEQIDLALDQMGARLNVEIRAEALIFRGAVLSSQLEPYLKLFTEILTEPTFPESEIKKLKAEIVSGIQEEIGNDGYLASRKFNEFLFKDHPYGKSALGKKSDIESLTRQEILSHYRRLIQNHLMLVIGTGAAPPQEITAWAKKLGELRPTPKLTAEEAQLLEKVPAPTFANHRKMLLVDKPDRTQTQINIGQIGILMTDPDFFPLYLGNHAFGGGSFSAILMDEIRVKRGWSYGANSGFRFGLRPRYWVAHLFPAEKDTAEALAYSLKLIEELQKKGITKEQFEFAQRSLVNSAGFNFNTPTKRVENKLLEKTLGLPNGFIRSYGPELQKVKLEDVNRALHKFLKPDRLAISVLCTSQKLREKLIKAAGVDKDQVEVMPYTQE